MMQSQSQQKGPSTTPRYEESHGSCLSLIMMLSLLLIIVFVFLYIVLSYFLAPFAVFVPLAGIVCMQGLAVVFGL